MVAENLTQATSNGATELHTFSTILAGVRSQGAEALRYDDGLRASNKSSAGCGESTMMWVAPAARKASS